MGDSRSHRALANQGSLETNLPVPAKPRALALERITAHSEAVKTPLISLQSFVTFTTLGETWEAKASPHDLLMAGVVSVDPTASCAWTGDREGELAAVSSRLPDCNPGDMG